MHPEVASRLPLVCPACRTRSETSRDMHTLGVARSLASDGEELLEGALQCDNAKCARRYPVVDGVPLLVDDLPSLLSGALGAVVEGPLDPETEALLAAGGPDEAPWPHLLEHLSIYLDAHWGDRAEPPPDGPVAGFGFAALAERLLARPRVKKAVELGCSVGRGLALLAKTADTVAGVELNVGAARRARRILNGRRLAYARRSTGRHYSTAAIEAGDLAAPRAQVVVGNALDPPLVPGFFDRVLALNLFDAVRSPTRLCSVVDGLCAPGGEVILASPYAFASGIVDEEERLGARPAEELRQRFVAGTGLEAKYTVEDEAELSWSLRRDARSGAVYTTHWLVLQKVPH